MKTGSLLEGLVVNEKDAIAIECEQLENVFNREYKVIQELTIPKHRSGLMAALEDNAIETTEARKSTIQKLIDYIIKFVRRILESINDYMNGSKAKENADFVKKWKGPTELGYAKSVNAFVKKLASQDQHVAERLTDVAAPEEGQQLSLEYVAKQYQAATGRGLTDTEKVEIFRKNQLESMRSAVGSNNVRQIQAMLDPKFLQTFKKASELTDKFTNKRVYHDNVANHHELSEEVMGLVQDCGDIVSETTGTDKFDAWVLNTDHAIAIRALDYIEVDATLLYCTHYIKGFKSLIDELKQNDSEETVERLRITQKTLVNITAFVGLAIRCQKAYNNTIDALRRV